MADETIKNIKYTSNKLYYKSKWTWGNILHYKLCSFIWKMLFLWSEIKLVWFNIIIVASWYQVFMSQWMTPDYKWIIQPAKTSEAKIHKWQR